MKKSLKNTFTDQQRLEYCAQKIHDSGIDITADERDWTLIAYACASQGEAGRAPYHLICSLFPRYNYEECDRHFTYCLNTSKNCISIGTIVEFAKRHCIDVSLPKGRPSKTAEQKEQEEKNRFEEIRKWLEERFEFRHNTITEQTEVRAKSQDAEWKEMDDRQLNSLLTELHADNVHVSKANLETYICSEMISPAYNPVVEFAKSLPAWKPKHKDYKTINQERAFAQAYYLATHPKAFPLEITPEETEKLKEINQKYVQQDLLSALLPTVLRQPEENEQAQAVTTGEIIEWLTSRNGPNRDFTPTKVGTAMAKQGFVGIKTRKGKQYLVVRIFADDLTKEGKSIANQILGM